MKGREKAHSSKSHGRRVESGTSNSSEYGENMRLEGGIVVDGVMSEREEGGKKGKRTRRVKVVEWRRMGKGRRGEEEMRRIKG
jgi:hypothetical protein